VDQAQSRKAVILGEFLGAGCITEATGILDVRRTEMAWAAPSNSLLRTPGCPRAQSA